RTKRRLPAGPLVGRGAGTLRQGCCEVRAVTVSVTSRDSGRGRGGLENGFDHGLDVESGHATEINGADAAEARGTRGGGFEEAMAGVAGGARAAQLRRGAAEGDNDARAEGGGHVHGTAVIGEQH